MRKNSRRHAWVAAWLAFQGMLPAVITGPAGDWMQSWWTNRSSILLLTGVNVTITTASEFISRSIAAPMTSEPENNTFILTSPDGHYRIHRQSMINIFMTLFASVLGGPIYFILKRRHRFQYFMAFGVVNSLMSQGLLAMISSGAAVITFTRLAFDLVYNGTVRFFMFEVVRPLIVQWKDEFILLSAARVGQDFLTTLLKIAVLCVIGLRG
ncbi:MAG: hypothetical protein AB7P04_07025 [Bacteriovoracia bacterium]